jgi:hypothetical protein
MAAVREEMQEGAGRQQYVGQQPQHVTPVLAEHIERDYQRQRDGGENKSAVSNHGAVSCNTFSPSAAQGLEVAQHG